MVRSLSGAALPLGLGGAACALAFACSSSSSASPGPSDEAGIDAGDEGAVPGYPAPHSPMPQALTSKGPVMSAPKLVTITFMNDALQADIDKLGTQLAAATGYFQGAVGEYGVGALTALTPVHVDQPAPATATDSDVQAWLAAEIAGDAGAFPQPDGNTIYAIYYPSTTKVTMGTGSLCTDFQGYHSNFVLPATTTDVTYSVIGRCPPPVAGLAEIDEVSAEAVHEIVEAATDPGPFLKPAYGQMDAVGMAWAFVGGGGEIGDVCAPFPDAFFRTPGVDNLVQRVWSNQAAAAGHAPCQPQGTSPYFNSAPQLTDTITVTGSPIGAFTALGLSIPIGQSKTVELDLYSDGPTSGPWKITVLDLTSQFFGGAPALSFSLDTDHGQNGDKVNLTITALSKSSVGASPFWIQNDLGTAQTVWAGLVTN